MASLVIDLRAPGIYIQFMRSPPIICLLLVLGMFSAGCENVAHQSFDRAIWANYIHLNQVKPGMTIQQVVGIMGRPGILEEGDYRGGHYVFYFYHTHSMDFEDSDTVRNGYTPMVFQEKRLVGIGKRAYRSAVERPEGGKFPNLPWEGVK